MTGERDRKAIYEALGRFLVEFSQLVGEMEAGVISMAGIGNRQDSGGRLAAIETWQHNLTGIGAERMQSLFFGVASTNISFNSEEEKIRSILIGQVMDMVNRRNMIAHGVWYTDATSDDTTVSDKALLVYSKLSAKSGIEVRDATYTAESLNVLCDDVAELRRLVTVFAAGSTGRPNVPRISERLQLVDRKSVQLKDVSGWSPPPSSGAGY